ncbi:hypothetical protein [Roseinatronobacter sp. S2]|uniref:hypothetical protein n=1 Tax=Roseinatronobacter sp. S2 TaxID=3035471 RepID=UPI00240F6BC3|nr:hypothetical protein [Roseinatronobacter sp. S2]WFE76577.1 hypothetical protein P8S53_18840 [Roseinatronobacter sp. S2]
MTKHFMIGVALGWSCSLLLIRSDAVQIGPLLASYDSPALMALFFAKGGLYFGTFAMSVAIMNMDDDDPAGGKPDRYLFFKTFWNAVRARGFLQLRGRYCHR